MNSRTLRGLFKLIRPLNVGIAAVATGGAVVLGGARWHDALSVVLAMVTGALVTAGANAINDYFDYEIDRINRPERPVPRGDLSRRDAWTVWALTSIGGISVNIFLHWGALVMVSGSLALLYWYSAYWKRTALMGNLVVACMTGMAFLYGGVVGGNVRNTLVPSLFAALLTFAREVLKDIEDVEGDLHGNARTFPILFGKHKAVGLITADLVLLSAALWAPVMTGFYGLLYSVLIVPVNVALVVVVVSVWKDLSPKNLRRQSSLLKGTMIMGLIAVILGSFG
jgi:geranylgeranylglycerol-phosphate geranylgeranyltransferase